MSEVVSAISAEKATFNGFHSLKIIQPLHGKHTRVCVCVLG